MYGVRCRAVVTDLDGTIVRANATISAATLWAAEQLRRRGIPLIAATGRTPTGFAVLDALVPYVAVAVCCGGALGWSPRSGRVLWREFISAADVTGIVDVVADRIPGAGLAAYDGARWAVTDRYVAVRNPALDTFEIVAAGDIAGNPACALAVCHADLGAAGLMRELTAAGCGARTTLTYSASNLVDIAPAGVDKSTGVGRALDMLAVPPDAAMVFGDMPNDLPMFRLCGHPVAVGNAHPDVLAAARTIAATVTEDGFSRLLTELGVIAAGAQGPPGPG